MSGAARLCLKASALLLGLALLAGLFVLYHSPAMRLFLDGWPLC